MSNRIYNVYFNLHTVSGIVITVGLFVIFFAGAFTLFLKEVEGWEHSTERYVPMPSSPSGSSLDLDRLIRVVEGTGYDLYGRDVYLDLRTSGVLQPFYLSASEDTLATGDAKEYKNLLLNRETYALSERPKNSSATLSGLLYELHFFYQLGEPGYYLSGLVSLFFLFAMVSGIVVHWKKIVSNFYRFRPFEKMKTVWTDAHTALGTIGIPFQFMYALTGTFFGLSILVSTSGALLYGGDQSKYYGTLYERHGEVPGPRITLADYRLNALLDSAAATWPGFNLNYISLHKTASATMELSIYGEVSSKSGFFNFGEVEFDVASGRVKNKQDPYKKDYAEMVSASIHRLHFGYFGLENWQHLAVKVLYFLMALATCFVIITGVLIWLEARNKKSISEKERKFNQALGHSYLALCLSMLPVTALSFLVVKLLPDGLEEYRAVILNLVFFGGWLLTSIFFWSKKNNYVTNAYTLLLSGVFGLCIPIANGLKTGNWFWFAFTDAPYTLFVVDLLWVIIAALCLLIVYQLKPQRSFTA